MNDQERREALHQLADEAYALGWNRGDRDALNEDIEGLLALLAPEPEPSEREIEAAARFIDGVQFSDQAWEAMPVSYRNTMRHRAKAALLAAARAARQTGGES